MIKFAPANGDKNEPFFEAACIELANTHGVKAVNARLLSHSAGAALAVERFDRLASGERFYIQSLAALLNVDFRILSTDYLALFEVSKMLSVEPESERIYRQACFNVALSIKDDHSKNFAFMMDKNGKWLLSPAFDLCPNDGPAGWRSMSVCGEEEKVRREHLLGLAKEMGLSDGIAKDGIDKALEASSKFSALALRMGAQKKATKAWEIKLSQIAKDLK